MLADELPICDGAYQLNGKQGNGFEMMGQVYTGHSMQNTRSSHHQADPGSTSEIAIRACGIASSLFVSKGYETNAQLDGLVCDLDDGYPDETEDNTHSKAM